MTWKVRITARAEKSLKSISYLAKQRIEKFIDQLESVENPRATGKSLQGEFKGLWRYRVGDYRLVCDIQDSELTILVIHIGHRKDIYN